MIRKISVYEQVIANLGDMLVVKIRKILNSGSGSKNNRKSFSPENIRLAICKDDLYQIGFTKISKNLSTINLNNFYRLNNERHDDDFR